MHRRLGGLLSVGLLFIVPIRTAGADATEPKDVIGRAIVAAGGKEKLAGARGYSWKGRGKSLDSVERGEFTDEWLYQFPSRARYAMVELTGFKRTIISVLNGDKAWVCVNGSTYDMAPDWVREYQERTHVAWVATLIPLSDPAFTLDALGEKRVQGQQAIGVRVSFKNRRDVSLYFDKQTGLLLTVETRHKNPDTGAEHIDELVYREFQEVNGVKRPLRTSFFRDGKLTDEGEIHDFKVLDRIDNDRFAKPILP
jgi:hypothetical protein